MPKSYKGVDYFERTLRDGTKEYYWYLDRKHNGRVTSLSAMKAAINYAEKQVRTEESARLKSRSTPKRKPLKRAKRVVSKTRRK